jgi:two-component system response regulator ResD
MSTAIHILVVDDETTVREVVRRYLEREGFRVSEASDGYIALDEIAIDPPDLIILDLMLPGVDGLTITRQLRQRAGKKIPIIMLTAKGETSDRIRGLDVGADDYMGKPFSPRELVSRVKAVFRRTGETSLYSGEKLVFEGLLIDPESRKVQVNDQDVILSAKEFDLLYHFACNPRRVASREQLLEAVWGYGYIGDASTVTVHIRRLREKIEPDPSNPTYIHTVWGVGYKFDPEET